MSGLRCYKSTLAGVSGPRAQALEGTCATGDSVAFVFAHVFDSLGTEGGFVVFFVRAIGTKFRDSKVDLLMVVHHFLYICYLCCGRDSTAWCAEALTVIFPSGKIWLDWRTKQQRVFENAWLDAFSDECHLLTECPVYCEDALEDELKSLKQRVKDSDLGIGCDS